MNIKPLDVLHKYYGYTSFRKGQENEGYRALNLLWDSNWGKKELILLTLVCRNI